MEGGFEALADATLLLVVLLAASALAIGTGGPPPDRAAAGLPYAEDLREAVFRTTMDGLGYTVNATSYVLPPGATVETFLRVEVGLASRHPEFNFSAANGRVSETIARLVRPGWEAALVGKVGDAAALQLPASARIPGRFYASGWTYPSLEDGPEVRLSVLVWLSPPR